ncbi:MAG: hypothetical protein H7202_10355 [Pedobacter sp.]|nr:hypothetical protein [Pedobacter sp.]
MAVSKNNIVTESLSGKVGNVIFKYYGNKTVISKSPDMSRVVKSAKQLENQDLFGDAHVYAKGIIADPAKKLAFIKTIPKGKMAYHAAVSKYLKENKVV